MYRMSMWTWGVGGTNWEIKTDVCALPCDDLEGRDGAGWDAGPRGRGHTHTHTHRADSFCCRAETNTTL